MGCCALAAEKPKPFRYDSYDASPKAPAKWLEDGSPEAQLLQFDSEWYDAMRNMAVAKGDLIAERMPVQYAHLAQDRTAVEAVRLYFEAMVEEKFRRGNEFWNALLFTFLLARGKPSEGLPLERFDELCVAIFNDPSMARRMVPTFTRADVNHDGVISFPELVSSVSTSVPSFALALSSQQAGGDLRGGNPELDTSQNVD